MQHVGIPRIAAHRTSIGFHRKTFATAVVTPSSRWGSPATTMGVEAPLRVLALSRTDVASGTDTLAHPR